MRSFGERRARPKGEGYTMSRGHNGGSSNVMIYEETLRYGSSLTF